MMKTFGLLVFIAALCSLGIMCFFFPERTQDVVIKLVNWAYASENHPLKTLVRSSNYLKILRAVGAIALIMFCFLIWAFVKNL